MDDNPLPVALFDGLLLKLITVLDLIQGPEGTVTPQARQAVLNATNDFKSTLSKAKDLAVNLPGGDLRLEEQVEVIELLTELRDHASWLNSLPGLQPRRLPARLKREWTLIPLRQRPSSRYRESSVLLETPSSLSSLCAKICHGVSQR
ncbi:Mediator of RNA polymerase II transcription subunit 9 [Mycena chlorophos]|uniref:Mediator of RNA polymerase II transcription subunit 9 n=1 Tax=Mycena chlorophos TaxID=658473 RepID=A0A8H6T864_MYCCL|nr:Mediator of RNA polymerase II transcription subunit 9 [Mycena chlorophos]